MVLLLVYILLALVGNAAVYFVVLAIEQMWPTGSLLAFLALFFTVLWLAWVLAVKITAPRGKPAA
ncbi:MAG TPA: hypothetical protein VG095_10785 [Chthoniobacterales bacterium]|nr:hypothetical protein [Chthoniobacterales bacterium]